MGIVTTQQIKERTSIGGNVDPDKLRHLIDDIEFMVVEKVLGTKLYDKIVSDYEGSTLAGDYATIYNDYLVRIIAFSVYAEYLRDSVVVGENQGAFSHNPEDATVADLDNIEYVVKRNQTKADTLIDRLIDFLCDKNITEYENSQDNDYDIKPDTDIDTIGGWFLD